MSIPSYESTMRVIPARTSDTPTKIYTGGCHCGRFKFECRHPILEKGFEVITCTCSICTMRGILVIYILNPKEDFKMTQGSLEECHQYAFYRKIVKHLSCPDCATALFCDEPYDIWAINVRCLDGINENLEQLTLRKLDGRKF